MHVPSGDGQVILGKESSPKVGTCQPLLYILGRDVGGLEDGTRDLLGNLLDLIERQDIAHHIGVEIPARQVQRSDGKGRDVLDAREGEFRLSVDEEACGVLADVDAERIFAEAAVGLFLISQSPLRVDVGPDAAVEARDFEARLEARLPHDLLELVDLDRLICGERPLARHEALHASGLLRRIQEQEVQVQARRHGEEAAVEGLNAVRAKECRESRDPGC